jgi:hypothetical protein
MLPKLARLDGQFPFLDILEKRPPFRTSDGNIWYEASKNSDIDVEKNTHFALGIFWNASVHPWSGTKKDPMIDLGPIPKRYAYFLRARDRIPNTFPFRFSSHDEKSRSLALSRHFKEARKGATTFCLLSQALNSVSMSGKACLRWQGYVLSMRILASDSDPRY